MSSSLESQVSYEDVETDTASWKNHRNGSDTSTSPTSSPPKRQKVKKRKRLCKETVKQDTVQVMRSYLLRCQSVTEDDLEGDLETDAGDDDSADESQNQQEIIDKVAHRLQEMGDDIQEKYAKEHAELSDELNKLIKSVLTESIYASFKNTLQNFCHTLSGDDTDADSLAFVFYLTQRFIVAAKEAGKKLDDFVNFGNQYVNDVYGEWIEEQGGWGQVLGDGTAV